MDVEGFTLEERLTYAHAQLAQERGKDVVWGWYAAGSEYVSRALVACPRPKRHQYAEDSPPACPSPL
ncbi:hypothetical protein [Streptomyces sp. NPDC058773]|uniref:hypothetical protein n=1 Tax=Streptomyces sp. NPDC058773 TaxID=3346632 RepID=UPI0036D1DF1F